MLLGESCLSHEEVVRRGEGGKTSSVMLRVDVEGLARTVFFVWSTDTVKNSGRDFSMRNSPGCCSSRAKRAPAFLVVVTGVV